MSLRCKPALQRIDRYDPVGDEFLYHLKNTLLLALREQGTLTPMQHRHAEEKLRKQYREQARRKQYEHDQGSQLLPCVHG